MQIMRHIIVMIALLSCSFLKASAQQKEIFIKQLEFKLEHVSAQAYENEYFMTIKLNKGTSYKFKITNHRDNFAGKAVIQLLDADNLVLTNTMGEKYFETIGFVCNKTAFYDILIKYKDNKPGSSVVDIVMLQ
jgi:hypothetical protein